MVFSPEGMYSIDNGRQSPLETCINNYDDDKDHLGASELTVFIPEHLFLDLVGIELSSPYSKEKIVVDYGDTRGGTLVTSIVAAVL